MPFILKRKTSTGGTRYQARVSVGLDGNGKRRIIVETFATATAAKQWARDQLTARDRGELVTNKATMNVLFDDLLLNFNINRKTPWAAIVIKAHLRPCFGAMRADQITTSTLNEYVAARQAKGRANGTITRELTILKRAFHLAQQCTPPKVAHVPHFPRLREDPPRKGFFEAAEYEAMLAALPEELKPVLVFAYHTGCRRGEILGLQWPQVDLLERAIRLEPGTTKNDEARTIPLAYDVVQVLAMQREIRDRYHPRSPWVFFRHATGQRLKDFRGAWETACKKCGLWDETKQRPLRILHDTRRTGVRNLVRAGVPERVAMSISGHKTRSVFDRYNIVSEADLKEAALRLDSYLTKRRAEKGVHSEYMTVEETPPGTPENAPKLLN